MDETRSKILFLKVSLIKSDKEDRKYLKDFQIIT